jgi:hypothetical protein
MSLIPFGFWAASGAGGGAGAFDLLETTTLTSSASSVTFSGLGAYSDYKHLQIRSVARDSGVTTNVWTKLVFNNDTSANYTAHLLYGDGSAVTSDGYTGFTWAGAAMHPGASNTNAWGGAVIDILDFSSSNKNKTVRGLSGWEGSAIDRIMLASGLWLSTSAITQIAIVSGHTSFLAGSRFSLYGVK